MDSWLAHAWDNFLLYNKKSMDVCYYTRLKVNATNLCTIGMCLKNLDNSLVIINYMWILTIMKIAFSEIVLALVVDLSDIV